MDHKIKITLVRSLIGRIPKHITIANQLGLRKMHSEVVHSDTPAIRGMLKVIYYLVDIEECTK